MCLQLYKNHWASVSEIYYYDGAEFVYYTFQLGCGRQQHRSHRRGGGGRAGAGVTGATGGGGNKGGTTGNGGNGAQGIIVITYSP